MRGLGILECGDSSPLFRSFCAHMGKGVPADAEIAGLSSAILGRAKCVLILWENRSYHG